MFEKKTWRDRNVQHPSRRRLTQVSDNVYDVSRDEGTIVDPGDAFSADTMNDLESRIEDACNGILTATLNAGQTTVTVSDPSITSNSVLGFYTSIWGVSPTSVVTGNGNVQLEFDAQTSGMIVGVKVEGVY